MLIHERGLSCFARRPCDRTEAGLLQMRFEGDPKPNTETFSMPVTCGCLCHPASKSLQDQCGRCLRFCFNFFIFCSYELSGYAQSPVSCRVGKIFISCMCNCFFLCFVTNSSHPYYPEWTFLNFCWWVSQYSMCSFHIAKA